MAAVLSIGADAVLSHRSAAALWGIRETARARIDVAVPRALRSPPAIQLHRVRLSADEVTEQRGLRVTTPPRTLLDLAAVLTRPQLERALNEAEILRLADGLSVAEIVDRHPRRQGTRAIRAMLAGTQPGATVTRSELEDRFLAFLEEAVPQRSEVNAVIEEDGRRFEVDCLWRGRRLVAELDGHAVHGTTAAFERDRARDRILQAAGWRVVRVTWRQLHEERAALASDLRRLLAE